MNGVLFVYLKIMRCFITCIYNHYFDLLFHVGVLWGVTAWGRRGEWVNGEGVSFWQVYFRVSRCERSGAGSYNKILCGWGKSVCVCVCVCVYFGGGFRKEVFTGRSSEAQYCERRWLWNFFSSISLLQGLF